MSTWVDKKECDKELCPGKQGKPSYGTNGLKQTPHHGLAIDGEPPNCHLLKTIE